MRAIMVLLVAAVTATGFVTVGATAAKKSSVVTVGMPFTGKWAYNIIVHPGKNGRYDDNASSHPSVHAATGGGDWATDLYAKVGTPVRLHVGSSGRLSFSWASSSGCPSSTRIEVKVDGQSVGWIYYTHLSGAVHNGPISNGMTLGRIADPKKDGNCNPGPHMHIELKNAASGTHACWIDHGYPGTPVAEGTAIGQLGSGNKVKQQVCKPVVAEKPTVTRLKPTQTTSTAAAKPSFTAFNGTYVSAQGYRYRFHITMTLPVTIPRLVGPPGQMVVLGSPQMFAVTVDNLNPRRRAPVFPHGLGAFGIAAIYKVPKALDERRQKKVEYSSPLADGQYLNVGNEFSQSSLAGGYDDLWLVPNARWKPEPESITATGNSYLEGNLWGMNVPQSDYPAWRKLVSGRPDYVVLWGVYAFDMDGARTCGDVLLAWSGSGQSLNLKSIKTCRKVANFGH